MAMSRNMYEHDGSLLAPTIDRRNATNGITGAHFPLYEWSLAQWSKLTSFNELNARCFSMLLFSCSMVFMYAILLFLGIPWMQALFGGILLMSMPQLYYDGINAMPDILALMFALCSWRCQLEMTKSPKFIWVFTAF